VASLVALLEAGTTPWRREWDAASGGHHVNLLSGRRYRGANPALLTLGMHLRGSAQPYWCGFAEAKALGIFPRKSSKAVHVLRPQVHQGVESRLAESGPPAEGGHGSAGSDSQPSVQPGRCWVSYRPVALFNAADLEGEALAALIQKRRQAEGAVLKPEPERLGAAEAVLSRWPVPVCFEIGPVIYRCPIASSCLIALPSTRPVASMPPGPMRRFTPLAIAHGSLVISQVAWVRAAMAAGPMHARSLWPSWEPCCSVIALRLAVPWAITLPIWDIGSGCSRSPLGCCSRCSAMPVKQLI
jgi:hypothetical protein